MRKSILIYFSIAFLSLPAVAGADLIVGSGLIGGSGDVENVLFKGSGVVLGPAYTLTGSTNQTGSLVDFTGMENLAATAGGQERIGAADGFFDYLTIKMQDPNLGFSKIQFNIDSAFDGIVKFEFTDQFANVLVGFYSLDDKGQHFFTAYYTDGQVIVTAVIASRAPSRAIADIEQVRVNPTQVVPEPASMILFGTGSIVFARYLRKKFKK